jgi:hypothetical protein
VAVKHFAIIRNREAGQQSPPVLYARAAVSDVAGLVESGQ